MVPRCASIFNLAVCSHQIHYCIPMVNLMQIHLKYQQGTLGQLIGVNLNRPNIKTAPITEQLRFGTLYQIRSETVARSEN